VTLLDPPAGVSWALQVGRGELVAPTSAAPSRVSLDFTVEVKEGTGAAPFRLAGPAVQGRPGQRFVYINSGLYAGQPGALAGWRAKVPLEGITRQLIDAATTGRPRTLEAQLAGTARNGAPAHATVPLLGTGWRVT
jgi:hypothetical protein